MNIEARGQRQEARAVIWGALFLFTLGACQMADGGDKGQPSLYGIGTPASVFSNFS